MMPTTMLWLMTKGQWPQRVAMSAEKDSARPMDVAPGADRRQVPVGLGEGRADLGLARIGDGEGEDPVQVEARRGEQRHAQDGGDEKGPADDVELLAVKHVELDIEHGEPDPHGGDDLHQREAPVRDEQLQALEEHQESADDECQGGEPAPALAELEHRLLDGGVVAGADGIDEADDRGPDAARGGCVDAGCAPPVLVHRHLRPLTLDPSPSNPHRRTLTVEPSHWSPIAPL